MSMKNGKKTKGKRVIKIRLIYLIIIFFMAISIINLLAKNSTKKIEFQITPEILRSRKYEVVEDKDKNTQSEYVTFDAFFLKDLNGDGIADSIRGTCNEIGKEDTLYFELRVNDNGYLKNGTITINGKNFYLNTAIIKDDIVANNYISNNTTKIKLKDVQNGSQKLFTGIVRSGDYSNSYSKTSAIGDDITNYSKQNTIILKGTHVAEDGTETQIEKKVNFYVDWYSEVDSTIRLINNSNEIGGTNEFGDFSTLYDEENLNLEFTLETGETINSLLLKSNVLEGTIPELNGYKPINVTITGNNINYTYDKNTGKFILTKEAKVNENNIVTTNAYDYYDYRTTSSHTNRYNTYKFNISYPKESYQEEDNQCIELIIPVTTYNEGFNNPNDEFDNPYKSNISSKAISVIWKVQPHGDAFNFDVFVGNYTRNPYKRYVVSKEKPLRIYNGISEEETKDYYEVRWYAYTGKSGNFGGIILSENKTSEHTKVDEFVKTDSSKDSMEDLTSNVGIYFSGASDFLGENGWIKVYNDETNEPIATFDINNWNNYNKSNPYMYNTPVKHIRIETSVTNSSSIFTAYNIKKLNDKAITDKYYLEDFENLEYIHSNLVGYYANYDPVIKTNIADYEAQISVAKITLSQDQITTQETTNNEIITISTESSYYNEQKWKNGFFIVKLPQDIIDFEINKIQVSDPLVTITGYDVYEKEGNFYIKILTENEVETTYDIAIDCNVTPDPRMITKTEVIEMYAKNGQGISYYPNDKDIYDVDDNQNTTEKVNKNTVNISFVALNNLLTNQIAREFDKEKTEIIAPQVAKADKDTRTALIDVNVTNNYSNDITDIVIQGVIPFEGNKYVLGNSDLGSNYSTTMSNTGIIVPIELQDYATVYYSTKSEPTKDLSDTTNDWKLAENVADWSQIKTYLIDLGEYKMKKDESHTFTYEINIPEGVEYNQISYSEHGVYFALMTDAGKYYTSTAVSKLGFMIAKQYDLELTKYQKNTEKTLQGTTFKITEEGKENSSIKVTNENGKIIITGLYAERIYKIKEVRSTPDYVLNNEEIEIYTYIDENENLQVKYKAGENIYLDLTEKYSWIRSAITEKKEDEDYKAKISIENEVKAKFKLTKKSGEDFLKNIKFKMSGRDKNNVILTTNKNGEIFTSGLYLNETYMIEEVRADGYYLTENMISFIVKEKSGSGFELEIHGNNIEVNNSYVTVENEIPIVNLVIDDEKIPTYSLKLTKYAKHKEGVEDKVLEGAQYKLTGDGISENGTTLTTDENGELTISGLYEYVEVSGKPKGNIKAEYTLVETYAPEGFAIDTTEIKFKAKRNTSNELEVEIISGNDKISNIKPMIVTNASSEKPIVEFSVEDAPIFTLKKRDENGNPLANVKFEIYSIDDTGNSLLINEVTTDNSGEISLNLPEGLYKAVEVEAPEKYDLPEDEKLRTEYFGIGKSKPQESEFKVEWENYISGEEFGSINSIYATSDGGVVAAGSFRTSADLNEDEINDITSNGGSDGLIIKYNQIGNIEWSKVLGGSQTDELVKILQTADGGYVAIGHITTSDQNFGKVTYNGVQDCILIKLDNAGNVLWNRVIGGEDIDQIYNIAEDESGNLIVTGGFYSTELKLEGGTQTLTNQGNMDGFVAVYSSSGTLKWAQSMGGTDNCQTTGVAVLSDGYVFATNYYGTCFVDSEKTETLVNVGEQDSALIWYDYNGNFKKSVKIQGTKKQQLKGITKVSDGIIAYGNSEEAVDVNEDGINDFTSNGGYDIILLKYSDDGIYEENSSISFGGNNGNEGISEVVDTKAGDLLVSGWTYSRSIDVDGDGTNDISKSYYYDGTADSFLLKLTQAENAINKYNVVNAYKQYGKVYEDEEGRAVAELKNGGFVIAGIEESESFVIEPSDKIHKNIGWSDGFIAKYDNVITFPEIPEKTELEVHNKLKRFNVITQIYSAEEMLNNGENKKFDVGGIVSGNYGNYDNISYPEIEHKKYVETIEYDKDGTKQIVITPDENYSVTKITINGENYLFTPDSTGKVIIPVFEKVTEDKIIIVEVNKNASSIIVNHYLWTESGKTTTKLADSEYYSGEINNRYTTSPRTDIRYQIITNKDYYGEKTEAEIIADINNEFDTTYAGLADLGYTEITDEEDENYGKTPLEQFLSDYFVPANATGKYKEEQQVVDYYYKEKEYKLTVHYLLEGTEIPVPDTTGNPILADITEGLKYNEQYKTNTSEKIDYSKYELVSDTGNTEGVIEEDTIVKYYYKLKDGAEIVVHHYIVGTTTQVPSKVDGETVQDVHINTVIDDEKERQAKVGDGYTTSNAVDSIAINYKVATNEDVYGSNIPVGKNAEDYYVPENQNGVYTDKIQEVIYYYIQETPDYTNTITKTGTTNITKEDEIVNYNINYNVQIEDYKGNASVTVTDYLPYEIDLSKSSLNGGTYNNTSKTITWKELRNIDTYANPNSGKLSISKSISVVYKNLDYSKMSMVNKVTGQTYLIDTNVLTDMVQSQAITNYKFTTDVTVTKIWKDNNNSLKIRPDNLEVTLKATVDNGSEEQIDYEIPNTVQKVVTLKNTTGETNGENWKYTWQNLDKYSSTGKLINYTIEENLIENLSNIYTGELTGEDNNFTLTNTYQTPEDRIDLVINKKWVDNNNELQKRPLGIILEVYKESATITKTKEAEYLLKTEKENSHIFKNLLKYDEKGNRITYTVEEKEANENDLYFYQKTSTEVEEKIDEETGNYYYETTLTNTFQVPNEKTSIIVDKVWNDNNNENDKRPNYVNIIVSKPKEMGTEIDKVEEYMLNISENESSHTFTNLEKYDGKGNEILYVISEEEVNENDLKFYSSQVKQDATNKNKYTIINTYTVPEDKINIEAEKIWDDNNNIAKKRPNSVKIKLMNGKSEIATQLANSTNNWRVTFEGVAKYDVHGNEINYVVEEEEINTNDLKFYSAGVVSGSVLSGFKITNRFNVPDEKIQISTTKIWKDNNINRLTNIIFVLTGNDQEYTHILTKANELKENTWEYIFTNLPKYDSMGNEIIYTLSEREVNTGDLNRYIQNIDRYTLTNTLIVKNSKIEKTGTSEITSLNDKVEYQVKYEAEVDEKYKGNIQVTIVDTLPYEIDTEKEYNLDGGVYNATNKTITWTETEKEVTKNISLVYKDIDVTKTKITNNVTGTIELENGYKEEKDNYFDTTLDFTRKISVSKVWKGDSKDNGNGNFVISNSRPESIEVILCKKAENGILAEIEEKTLNLSNNWKFVWDELPKYDANTRKEIEYVVTEKNVPKRYYSIITRENDEFTVTNSKYGSITLTKVDSIDNTIKLGGAEFKLEKLKKDGGKIEVDENFKVQTKTTEAKEGDTKGQVKFENLQYGTYRLTEIKAPQGYNILPEIFEIEITEENIDYTGEISNRAVTRIPDTGSFGKIGSIILGIIVLGTVFTVKVKRKGKYKNSKHIYK